MHKLTILLTITALSLHTLATPIAQDAPPEPYITPAPTLHQSFCAKPSDCAQMDPNTVFPARIDDVGAFFESQPRHCNGGNPDPTCWVDVATHGSCQVSLVWWGDVGKFKGHAVERETLVEMATPMLGERKDFPGCSGDLQTVVTDYANWHVAVKAFGLDLWE